MFKFIKNILGLAKSESSEKLLEKNKKQTDKTKSNQTKNLNQPKKSQGKSTGKNASPERNKGKKEKFANPDQVTKKIIKPLTLNEVEVVDGKKRFFDYNSLISCKNVAKTKEFIEFSLNCKFGTCILNKDMLK